MWQFRSIVLALAVALTNTLPTIRSTRIVNILNRGLRSAGITATGSNILSDYRHQADTCHAYKLLRQRRIQASNIVVIMCHDIANNKENLFKDVGINSINFPNDDIEKMFHKVLQGQNAGSESLESGNDLNSGRNHIGFFNFSNSHRLTASPESYLDKSMLLDALKDKGYVKLDKSMLLDALKDKKYAEAVYPKGFRKDLQGQKARSESIENGNVLTSGRKNIGFLYFMKSRTVRLSASPEIYMFFKVLQGQKARSESRVITSGPNDYMFVIFNNSQSLSAFPDDNLFNSKLLEALKDKGYVKVYKYEFLDALKDKKYKKMNIKIEAFELNSKYKNLPQDINK